MLVDAQRAGVGASHRLLATHEPLGAWLWVLDDDDECVHPGLVADVRRLAGEKRGLQVVMVRMDHGQPLGVLPDAAVWERAPVHGHLGVSSYIVRRDMWKAHRAAWLSLRYQSDYDFIADVWQSGPVVVWHDVIASRCQRGQLMGAGE